MAAAPLDKEAHITAVRGAYAETALGKSVLGGGGGCCGADRDVDLASAHLGYADADLALGKEADANLGLGCGNPIGRAALRPGERVLDLGAGAGFDAFLAARLVGPTGLVIGVDMTPEMVARARAAAARLGYGEGRVQFRLGELEHLPAADASVDVIVSNCVINLAPDKAAVLREAYRVLRPGGRVCVSDVVRRAASGPMPEALRTAEALAC